MILLFGVSLVALVSFGEGQQYPAEGTQGSGPPLSGANVCQRLVTKNEWEDVTEDYYCWETVEVDSSLCEDHSRPGRRECYWGWQRPERHRHGDRRRGKRGTDCYKLELKTCQKTVRKLVCKKEYENVCCPGYNPDGAGNCVGEYSCVSGNGGCEHMCILDWDGSSKCACYPGYTLTTDGKCLDINECETGHMCNHKCLNTDGGYYCACNSGYSLINPYFCAETDECAIGNGGCQHDCVNTRGAFYCLCEPGFELSHGKECIDTDECSLHNGGCSHGCINQYGYYECSCPEHMYLARDNKTCVDPYGTHEPAFPRVPGAEASKSGEDDAEGFPWFMIIGAICGAFVLILIVIISLCLMRRCKRSREEAAPPPPPTPVPAVFTNDYEDPVLAMKKKGMDCEAAMSFDNPGYGEKADPPPSYSRAAGTSSPHPYCQLNPPAYCEDTKSHSYEEIEDSTKQTGHDYDNAPETAAGNVKKLLENFEKKTEKIEERCPPRKTSSFSDKSYDNVINEIKESI